MEVIEIRHNKKKMIPMLLLLTSGLLGMTYFIYFSGSIKTTTTLNIIYSLSLASLLYTLYVPVRKFLKNEPVLTISKYDIEINESGKPVSFSWPEVVEWTIEKDKENNTQFLTIATADNKKKINISLLEKSPAEIETLLTTYKKLQL
jgi:hypothetical protein